MKKFEFTGETKTISLLFRTATLHRIRAVAEFGGMHTGNGSVQMPNLKKVIRLQLS